MSELKIDIKPMVEQAIRDVIILNIGEMWDDYCYRNNVRPEVKLEGIGFLEDFAKQLNDRT